MDSPSSSEIQEILEYIEMIQEYDHNTFIHLSSVVSIIWAFLFYFSGLLDFIFYQLDRGELTILSWFICSFFGMYIMKKIFTGSTYRPASAKSQASLLENIVILRKFLLVMVSLWIIVMFIAIVYRSFLVIPVVGLILGITFLIFMNNTQHNRIHNPFYRFILQHGVAYTALFSAFINLLLFFIIGINAVLYMGLIMGILLGTAFLLESKAVSSMQ